METASRIEQALTAAVARTSAPDGPPRLAEAIRHAVFPGGARIRPQICLAVARACGDDAPALSDAVAASVELLHCASLVHDDLPCFDDADTRRGRATVHRLYGAPLAVLAGDALIVLAFDTLARAATAHPGRLPALVTTIARAVGAPSGITAGQAWESEPNVQLAPYQRAKTGALFVGATVSGAIAAGGDPGPWRALGEKLGEAYQVADDLADAVASAEELGKPVRQDTAHDRPNAVAEFGLDGALTRLRGLVEAAAASVPDCRGAEDLRRLVRLQATRLAPSAASAAVTAA